MYKLIIDYTGYYTSILLIIVIKQISVYEVV